MLIAATGASRITRDDLRSLPVPVRTETHQPIAHSVFVEKIEEALAFRHIEITKEDYAVSDDGMRFFGVLQVNATYEGVSFVIGCRNSNDKAFRIGMVTGFRVNVCSNLSFNGDFMPLSAKHTKNFELEEAVAIGIDRTQRMWQPMREALDYKRTREISDTEARETLYRLFTDGKMPVSLFRSTHEKYFLNPSHDEFKPRTLWSLENAVTENIKRLKPIAQYEQTARLGKFISGLVQSRPKSDFYPVRGDDFNPEQAIDVPAVRLN